MSHNEIRDDEIDALMPPADVYTPSSAEDSDHESEVGWSRGAVHTTVRAVLSASGAQRWLNCPGSLTQRNTTGRAAQVGTEAHDSAGL